MDLHVLLRVDVFVETLCQSQWSGLPGSPSAFETIFGWVIAGETVCTSSFSVTSCHSSIVVDDDIIVSILGVGGVTLLDKCEEIYH